MTKTKVDMSAAAVRTWARSQGLSVGARGTIAGSVIEAYVAAHK